MVRGAVSIALSLQTDFNFQANSQKLKMHSLLIGEMRVADMLGGENDEVFGGKNRPPNNFPVFADSTAFAVSSCSCQVSVSR